jgi:hypothetical protein
MKTKLKEYKITTTWHGSTYVDWYDAKGKLDALAQYEKDFDEWVGSQHRSKRTIKVEEIKPKPNQEIIQVTRNI